MKETETKKIHLALKVKRFCEIDKVKKMISFPNLELEESVREVSSYVDLKKAKLTVASKFTIAGGCVYSGTYLKDDSIIFSQSTRFGCGPRKFRCTLFNVKNNSKNVIGLENQPVSVRLHGKELYISNIYKNIIYSSCFFPNVLKASVKCRFQNDASG
jgi:hypothetical protein